MRPWLWECVRKIQRISLLAAALALAACDRHVVAHAGISGDSPQEIATSIRTMRMQLDGAKEAQFTQAIATLSLVVPDRNDSRTVGAISPQFSQMVRGRDADGIIQLAELYRNSVPEERPYPRER